MAKNAQVSWKVLLLVGALLYVAGSALFTYSYSVGPNYRNVSVDTTVNITNARPTVLSVIIQSGATNLTLNAGTFLNVTCNATVQDFNGGNTITNVSAMFFDNVSSTSADADDNNTHYSNTNCTLGNFDNYTRNVSCNFLVQYYANASMWTCNVTATDPYVFGNASRLGSGFNYTHIDALLALNVTPLIDYGDLAVGDLSLAQQANITNFGNRNINISVRGYAVNSTYNLAMICDVGNISIEHEKFNLIGGSDLAQYTNLSNSSQLIPGLTVAQQTNDAQQVINTSYWVLYVPPNPFGRCNGTVVFQAEASQ
jgi:hypothetical protein